VDAGPFQAGDEPGSGLEDHERDLLAGAAISGLGTLVNRYLDTEDSHEAAVIRDLMLRGIALDGERREDQANRIIGSLARALDNKGTHQHG
jgi:hypothetical protein